MTSASPGPLGKGPGDDVRPRGLHAFSVFVAVWTFALLSAGGVVTGKEAGLAVPDWPLSYGFPRVHEGEFLVNPPRWTETPNVFEEHLHRLLGWGLGVLVIVLAAWIQRVEPRRWMRRLGWTALALVCVQGVIGGYFRVVLLQHRMAIVHGVLGQAFFCLLVAIALFTSRGWTATAAPEPDPRAARLRRLSLAAVVVVFLQVVIGALVRHSRAGHELPVVLPHALFGLVTVVVALLAAGEAVGRQGRRPALVRPALLLGGGVLAQVLLGLGAWFADVRGHEEVVRPAFQVAATSIHQAAGALVLAAAVVLHLRTRHFLRDGAQASESATDRGSPAAAARSVA